MIYSFARKYIWFIAAAALFGQAPVPRPGTRNVGRQTSLPPAGQTRNSSPATSAYNYEVVFNANKLKVEQNIWLIGAVIGDGGQIVCFGEIRPAGWALFTKERVIAATGKSLPNGAIALTLTGPAINSRGQIAYGATFLPPECPQCRTPRFGYFVDDRLVLSLERDLRFGVDGGLGLDPSLTADGEIVIYDPLKNGLSRNGQPMFPLKQEGDATQVVDGEQVIYRSVNQPPSVIQNSGEIVFKAKARETSDTRRWFYSTLHGKLAGSDGWRQYQTYFVNNAGDVGFLDSAVSFSVNGTVAHRFAPGTGSDPHFMDLTLWGFLDKDHELVSYQNLTEDYGHYLKVGADDVITDKYPKLFPDSPNRQVTFASMNPSGQIAIVKGGVLVLATPKAHVKPFEVKHPCDLPELPASYDHTNPNYHRYDGIATTLCNRKDSALCTVEKVFDVLIHTPAAVAPVAVTGNPQPVRQCGALDLFTFPPDLTGPGNRITVAIDDTAHSVTNYTMKGHIFYPGQVTRRVVENNGNVEIQTIGEGVGDEKWLNIHGGKAIIWPEADSALKDAVRKALGLPSAFAPVLH